MDDGKKLNAEWESGYDQWSIGERIILTTENGSGIMFFENQQMRSKACGRRVEGLRHASGS